MNRFLFLILVGLIIRLALMQVIGFKVDIDAWAAWASRSYELGFSNFYSDVAWTNYTPGYIYILYVLEAVKRFFNLSPEIFYVLLKIPSILAELALVVLVFKIVRGMSTSSILIITASLILFNPALIFNSAVWGQIDSILTLLLILTIYFLNKKHFILSSIFFGLSILIKPQALAIAPIFPLFIINNFSLKNFFKLSFPAILIILLFSFPFFINQPFLGFFQLLSKMIGDYPYISLNAYNAWGVLGFWINDNTKLGFLSYQQIGYIFYFGYWILLAYLFVSKRLSLYALGALACLSFFFLPTRAHERYLYPAIPFLVILFSFYKSKFILVLTILLSLMHTMNLYFVYIYYNVLYLKLPSALYLPHLYSFMEQNSKLFSFTSTLIFLIITYWIIKIEYARKNSYSKKIYS